MNIHKCNHQNMTAFGQRPLPDLYDKNRLDDG